MKYFLDSAKMEEIQYAYEYWGIDGITTNPKHVRLSGKSLRYFLEAIGQWIEDQKLAGYEKFPVSVEINPHLETWQEMQAEAQQLAALSSNFVIKIPCTEQGLIAARKLEQKGVRTNVTLVFSPSQAIPVGKLGACFVSPFVGWKENSGEDTKAYIQDIADIYRQYGFTTEIIVAALRSGKQIVDAARSGADIVTCGLDVYKESFQHPFTDYGLKVFQDAWDHTAK